MKTNTLPAAINTTNRNYLRGGGLHLLASIIIFVVCSLAAQAQTYLTPGDEYQFLCDKDEIMVQLINSDPGMNVGLISTSGIATPSYTYDPNTGELIINGLGLTGPKSYGQYNFDLIGAGYRFTIYLIECCGKTDFDLIIVTEVASALPAINNLDVLILDDLRIDQNTDIDNSQVYFGADAKISVNAGEDLNIRTSDLQRYCAYRWDGVIAESYPTRIEFSSSSIEGSARGFLLDNNTEFQAISSSWENNLIGIGIFDLSASGTYLNNSFIDLDDNSFDISSTTLSQHPSTTVSMAAYNSALSIGSFGQPGVHIFVNESAVHLGDPSNQVNEFRATGADNGIAIFSNLSTTGVSNNLFFFIEYGIYALESKLDVGGSTIASRNTLDNSQYFSEESSQHLRYNKFVSTNCIIDLPTNQTIAGITGTFFYRNNIDFSNATITGNSTTVNVVLDENYSYMSTTQVGYVTTSSLSAGVKIINNTFNRPHDVMSDKYCLRLLYTTAARVGDNFFGISKPLGDTSATPIPVISNHGIYMEGVQDAQIKANVFELRGRAIDGTGNLSNTKMSCNEFDSCLFGFYLRNATVSDQQYIDSAADNTWVDFVCGTPCGGEARIYANNVSPFDYFFSGSSSSNLDPWFGIGVVENIPTVTGVDFASVFANCSALYKTHHIEADKSAKSNILYPNPATNYFVLSMDVDTIDMLAIYTLDGRKVEVLMHVKTNSEIYIDLPKGLYLLKTFKGSDESSFKLVVQ